MTSSEDRGPSRRPGVLVAEDEPSLRLLLRLALEGEGFRVFEAADGLEGLGLYRRYRREIDAVVSDVRMPGLDGPGLLAALKAEDPGVRLVFVTAFSGDHDPDELLELGAAHVLSKPFPIEDLVGTVRALARQGEPRPG